MLPLARESRFKRPAARIDEFDRDVGESDVVLVADIANQHGQVSFSRLPSVEPRPVLSTVPVYSLASARLTKV